MKVQIKQRTEGLEAIQKNQSDLFKRDLNMEKSKL